ncbi:MAG: hypothetical protein ISS28_07550, partial [Candidatus Cloacimonetes bacterium]|nr:hypothetical protein [Candidatus Cloacimonadota bacterium]
GGYDGNISALDEMGFGVSIDTWQQVEFDISSYTCESVILRWHFASDGSVNDYYGWYIDNVLVGDPTSSYPVTGVSTDELHEPTKFALNQNYPNPFSSSTTISFNLATKSHENTPLDSTHLTGQAQIKIYNIKGQLVKTLTPMTNDQCQMTDVVWNGKDENGKPVSSGIYFYKLNIKNSPIKKMLLLR